MKTKRTPAIPFTNTSGRATQIYSGMVAGLGVIALLGWILDFPLLASIYSDYIPMAPNTAAAFVVSGITSFVLSRWSTYRIPRWCARAAAIFISLLGLSTLIQYSLNINLGIDQVLFITTKTLGKVPAGFMSPITATTFLLSGFSLLLAPSSPINGKYGKPIASSLATIVLFTGSVVILGYLYRTPPLYGGTTIPMALTTAIAFVFMGMGLISAAGTGCWPQRLVTGSSTRARLMRTFLPITVAIVIIMGWIYTVIVLQSKSNPALLSSLLAILFMVIVGLIISHTANIIGGAIDHAETKRKLAEIELLKLSQAVEQSPSTVVITDIKGNIEYVNPKFTHLTGYTSEEAIGQNPRILKSGETPAGEYKRLWNTITSGGEWRGEFRNKKKNGEFYWEYASISSIRNSEGVITHFLAVKEDITEHKHTERHLGIQHTLTHILAESATLDETASKILKTICEGLGWDYGGIWTIDQKANVLHCLDIWHVPSLELSGFKAITRQTTFSPGIGLPGRVWASLKPVWITDVVHDMNFLRAQVAAQEGLHGACSFPIINNSECLGTIEFFSRNIQQPNDDMLKMYDVIGSMLGQFIKRKQAEEELRKLSQAVEQSPVSVVITDIKGNIEYVNPKFTQITGYTHKEVVGQNPRVLKSDEIPSGEYKLLWETITKGGEWRGEFRNKKKNGEFYWEYASISPIKNPEGIITHFLAVKEDITERKKTEVQLAHLADRDPLTNLYNRRRFQEELEHWLSHARRYGINSTLMFLDVDNFKDINDTLGHLAGDEILISLAGILRKRLRETDIIARLGGDEFALLLSQVDADHALSIAQQLVDSVRQHTVLINGQPTNITISIGIAMFPDHGTTSETLLKYADLAMYQAKEEGRNRACVYTDCRKTKIELQVNWGKRIGNALDQNRFVLFLQPIMDLSHRRIAGYEALLRMMDENDGLIYPDRFLKAAEHSGLICDIDRWVVCRTIRLIAKMSMSGKNQYISANISCKAFADSELLSLIRHELSETGINPESLVLEITESDVITDLVEAQHFITTLKTMGCRFALDDFGVGFSSLNHLKHLPVDYVKIDGGFIHNLPNDPADQHLVRAIVEVARGLNKQTIAEFVECEETMHLLLQYGVNYAQGYHIGRPKAISEI